MTADPSHPLPDSVEAEADHALAEFLCPDDVPTGLRIVAAMTPAKRLGYERLMQVAIEIDLWEAGAGPKPTGVILCGPKQIRGARERKERKVVSRLANSPPGNGERE